MTNSTLWQRRDQALGSGAELFYEKPLEIVRGEGTYLFDSEGNRYVDMYNNVPCVGHANPAVVRAMSRTAGNPSPVGTAMPHGFVPTTPSRPPQGAIML